MSNETKPTKETALQKQAFEYYYGLKADRSYVKVALRFQKSTSTIEKWGKLHQWGNRVEKRDNDARNKVVEQQQVEKEVDFIQRNLKVAKRGIFEFAKAMQEGKIKFTVSDYINLVNLELKLRTGVDQRIQVDIRQEIQHLSNEEIMKRIEDKVDELKNLPSVQHFNELPKVNVIEADYKVSKQKEEESNVEESD